VSMANSLEVRVPFLDHEVVAAACGLSDQQRFEPLGQKRILREVALGHLAPALFDRPKSGFVLPIDQWARDALKEDMTMALHDARFCDAAGLDARSVRRLWTGFLQRARGYPGRACGPCTCSAGGAAPTGSASDDRPSARTTVRPRHALP